MTHKHCTNYVHFKRRCTSEPCCIICKGKSHSPVEKVYPGSAKQQLKYVITFVGKSDHPSNFYPCEVKVFGVLHRSSEHAYQYSKAIQTGKDKVAE